MFVLPWSLRATITLPISRAPTTEVGLEGGSSRRLLQCCKPQPKMKVWSLSASTTIAIGSKFSGEDMVPVRQTSRPAAESSRGASTRASSRRIHTWGDWKMDLCSNTCCSLENLDRLLLCTFVDGALRWLENESERPSKKYISSAPVSFPLIILAQAALYLETCESMEMTIEKMRSNFKGSSGHSQVNTCAT